MHIQHVEIKNFRKLQAVRIDFSEHTTVFVGANNSGKTSAMVALRRFLMDRPEFSITDFTLGHWSTLNELGEVWEGAVDQAAGAPFDWETVLPQLDIWLSISQHDLHHVQPILPSLEWQGEPIGLRLRYEPRATAVLEAKAATVDDVLTAETSASDFALWPKSMTDFLSKRLRATFEIRAYVLDPGKLTAPVGGIASPQVLPEGSEAIEGKPLRRLVQIDEITAQRGFGFVQVSSRDSAPGEEVSPSLSKKLSTQLRSYYTQHLDPFDQPEPKDLEALRALHVAKSAFGDRLQECFADALNELQTIGYPGVTDPKLTISANLNPVDGLNHASSVQYEVPTHGVLGELPHRLPEESNGLGYQNLVSMVFALMSFRDRRMKIGKASKTVDPEDSAVPPLHLVLIEEPEAHLHAQVQQVFIKQAYGVLRKNTELGDNAELRTQLVVSTHSGHVAYEMDFASLRYFRRLPAENVSGAVPLTAVVNLSQVFGVGDQTAKFAQRYLKATHCDLFFADGAILVEGPAERILVPHFVRSRSDYAYLRSCYISWLEIGGSHAHRLKPLIDSLGLTTLVITDIDAKDSHGATVPPARAAGITTRNETLKIWVPREKSLDLLLDATAASLVSTETDGYYVRVAYQQPITTTFKGVGPAEVLANTFEDALVFENIARFEPMQGGGLIKRFRDALAAASDLGDLAQRVRGVLGGGGKAEFAMDLLYGNDIDDLTVPSYIDGGLRWLITQLKRVEAETVGMPFVDAAAGNGGALPAPAKANEAPL